LVLLASFFKNAEKESVLLAFILTFVHAFTISVSFATFSSHFLDAATASCHSGLNYEITSFSGANSRGLITSSSFFSSAIIASMAAFLANSSASAFSDLTERFVLSPFSLTSSNSFFKSS